MLLVECSLQKEKGKEVVYYRVTFSFDEGSIEIPLTLALYLKKEPLAEILKEIRSFLNLQPAPDTDDDETEKEPSTTSTPPVKETPKSPTQRKARRDD